MRHAANLNLQNSNIQFIYTFGSYPSMSITFYSIYVYVSQAGGIVCLSKCAITADMSFEEDDDREQRSIYLRECQDRCNALWMNLDSYYVGEGGNRGHLELPTASGMRLP